MRNPNFISDVNERIEALAELVTNQSANSKEIRDQIKSQNLIEIDCKEWFISRAQWKQAYKKALADKLELEALV